MGIISKITSSSVLYAVAMIFMAAAIFAIMLWIPQPTHRVINCSLVEISPDFTTEMREACRKARMENYDRTKSKTSN
jgi:hypothetical protein